MLKQIQVAWKWCENLGKTFFLAFIKYLIIIFHIFPALLSSHLWGWSSMFRRTGRLIPREDWTNEAASNVMRNLQIDRQQQPGFLSYKPTQASAIQKIIWEFDNIFWNTNIWKWWIPLTFFNGLPLMKAGVWKGGTFLQHPTNLPDEEAMGCSSVPRETLQSWLIEA